MGRFQDGGRRGPEPSRVEGTGQEAVPTAGRVRCRADPRWQCSGTAGSIGGAKIWGGAQRGGVRIGHSLGRACGRAMPEDPVSLGLSLETGRVKLREKGSGGAAGGAGSGCSGTRDRGEARGWDGMDPGLPSLEPLTWHPLPFQECTVCGWLGAKRWVRRRRGSRTGGGSCGARSHPPSLPAPVPRNTSSSCRASSIPAAASPRGESSSQSLSPPGMCHRNLPHSLDRRRN